MTRHAQGWRYRFPVTRCACGMLATIAARINGHRFDSCRWCYPIKVHLARRPHAW